jgi:hypothetical protein
VPIPADLLRPQDEGECAERQTPNRGVFLCFVYEHRPSFPLFSTLHVVVLASTLEQVWRKDF